MAGQGTATLDFGAFPGSSDASVAVSAPSITGGSLVEAWIFPAATADHSADEHLVETIRVVAGNVQAGVGFTIYGFNTNQLHEPVRPAQDNLATIGGSPRGGPGASSDSLPNSALGGICPRPYGQFNVAWVWN